MSTSRTALSQSSASARGGLLEYGRAALQRGDWQAAREQFESLISTESSCPEAWEGLAEACYWLQDPARGMEARQAAYLGYRTRGESASAARVAGWLASDFLELRQEPAVAAGWLERARQLLEGLDPTVEHARLRALDAHMALAVHRDPSAARAAARDAGEIARRLSDLDHEMLARAIEGLSMVVAGETGAGMRLLDSAAAAALGGEMADLNAITVTCCYVIQACERVRDLERADEWCSRFKEICGRRRLGSFVTFCRLQHGTVLLWRGAWAEAEAELMAALADYEQLRPAARAAALVRVAELRRRQGRWEEAASLFDEARTHPLAPLWAGALALDRGDALSAQEAALRALRRAPEDDLAQRAAALELLIRAQAAAGALEDAARGIPQLEALAAEIGTDTMRGGALFAAGIVARAEGDDDRARRVLEDAADLLETVGCPYEAAHARLALSGALLSLNRPAPARAQARAALTIFRRLGSPRWADRASALMEESRGRLSGASSAQAAGPLTDRQREILGLVAQGLGNRDIAARLFLSEHTVRRHLANIYSRLGVSTRAAAVAHALRSQLL